MVAPAQQLVKRKRIGLTYTYNENWIGGTYYIENLINALNSLRDDEKPAIVLIINDKSKIQALHHKLQYPYLTFQLSTGEKNAAFQFLNRVSNRLFRISLFSKKIKDLDAVFPYYKSEQHALAKKKIYWVADFQEHFVPEFFSEDDIESRITWQNEIQASGEDLIVSSNDALHHFNTLFPKHTVSTSVLPFAVKHPLYTDLDLPLLLDKYKLPATYFICPNQFWKHKNQLLVINAVKKLKESGIDITVVFTGSTHDYRNPDYFDQLSTHIKSNNLGNNIRILGFIDRHEQLRLMAASISIIQPSLFEGWSTVVEDAKLMNKFLLASNINVHKEQLAGSSAQFFDPSNVNELAQLMQKTNSATNIPPLYQINLYNEKVEEFGRSFLKIAIPS